MAVHDPTSERLFVERPLESGVHIELGTDQAHYLLNVLRMPEGAELLIFNGQDGEWRARLVVGRKKSATLQVQSQTRPQLPGPDIEYLFAPLKHARLDYMVQKAVELGVSRLAPVLTRRTVPDRVNLQRMRANAIEAAEQCGVLRIPAIDEPQDLTRRLSAWDAARPLVFCDEAAPVQDPLSALSRIKPGPCAVLVGPEGGFDAGERQALLSHPFVTAVSLGPRIMRADTAAVAILSLVNATLGDWKSAI